MKAIKRYILFILLGCVMALTSVSAQTTYKATMSTQTDKASAIMLSYNNLIASYLDSVICVEVASNVDFTVTPKADWIKVVKFRNNYLYLRTTENDANTTRTGTVEITQAGGGLVKVFQLTQSKNNAASFIKGDYKVKVTSGTASDAQPGNEVTKSFDGDFSTMYHSSWGGGTLPVTLTYNFTNAKKIDYLVYNPRQSGGSNGNFNLIDVQYKLTGTNSYVSIGTFTLNESSSASKIEFPGGLTNPASVRVIVKSGTGGFASCSEMEFYQYNSNAAAQFSVFDDALCTTLKAGVTDEQISSVVNPYVRKLAKTIKSGTYSTEFRVNEFEAYPTLNETSSWMKTSNYNSFENPTGIYFEAGDQIVVFVDNPGTESVSLLIQNQVPGESGSSTYPLKQGINKIVAANKGQAYLNYYTTKWKTAPKVKVHFAMATVTGYFDLEKYKTPTGYDKTAAWAGWKRILAGAVSPMFDVISKRHHTCYPTAGFKKYYPTTSTNATLNGANFALAYDSIIYREHEIMGILGDKEPKNRQYTRSVASGMFADGLGAGIPNATSYGYIEAKSMDWWGLGHELGHVNQVRPAMKWAGTSEVTNNIYSAYVQHKLGNSPWIKSLGGSVYYRLEHESHGGNDIMNGVGGRFNAYLNYGIKDSSKWLLTEGPDYFGQTPFGTPLRRNYDHFVKLCPLWQLLLYFQEVGVRPNFYPQVFEMARKINATGMSNGALQLNFMRTAIDSTQLDLTPFFTKVGMLREYNDYIEDYSPGQITITKAQCDALKSYAAKYPQPESPVIYYICANNWTTFRDKFALDITWNVTGVEGLAKGTSFNSASRYVSINYTYVKNAVAFETYDSNNKLVRITMKGFQAASSSVSSTATRVLYPAGSARIDAIGWDGSRKTVYNVKQ